MKQTTPLCCSPPLLGAARLCAPVEHAGSGRTKKQVESVQVFNRVQCVKFIYKYSRDENVKPVRGPGAGGEVNESCDGKQMGLFAQTSRRTSITPCTR